MYRGVVQDGAFWTDFLLDYIKSRGLELQRAAAHC
jgi:hypothetical protein